MKWLLTLKLRATHPRTIGTVKIARCFLGDSENEAKENRDKFLKDLKDAHYTVFSHTEIIREIEASKDK